MSGNIVLESCKNYFVFENKHDKIIIKNVGLDFARGFYAYISGCGMHNIRFSYIKFGIPININVPEIISLEDSFLINLDILLNECKSIGKISFYNEHWKEYVARYNITKRYAAYAFRGDNQILIPFDTIGFLKGFQLAFAYHKLPTSDSFIYQIYDYIRIYRVYDNGNICHQYITYNIKPDYSQAGKIIRDALDEKHKTSIDKINRLKCHEIKRVLNDYMCNNLIVIILEYYLAKTCQCSTDYIHCETLCELNERFIPTCAVCKTIHGVNYTFMGRPFKIDIRLELAVDS